MDTALRAVVLGAGAGGGLPQWNCGCMNCRDARAGKIPGQTQSSLMVSADGETWVVLNASPDIRTQCAKQIQLAPDGLRGTSIKSVVLTNGDIDHIAGLLCLREKTAFKIFATQEILSILSENPVFSALDKDTVLRCEIKVGETFEAAPGIFLRAFYVPGKVPLFQEKGVVDTELISENTIGLMVNSGEKRLCYVPGCASIQTNLLQHLDKTDLLFFDGTLWSDTEMRTTRTGLKTGRRMGHIPISGPNGSLSAFTDFPNMRRAYIHINNTNPILQPSSPQRQTVEQAGWIVTQDGMEFRL